MILLLHNDWNNPQQIMILCGRYWNILLQSYTCCLSLTISVICYFTKEINLNSILVHVLVLSHSINKLNWYLSN